MSFTYDLSTNVGKVRLLIGDTASGTALFTDEEIAVFLDLEQSNHRQAAAIALDRIALTQALLLKKIEMLDMKLDGPALAAELRAQAKQLRDSDESSAGFDIAETAGTPFAERERLWKQMQRGAL